mgnify:CR=1 FL=1
MQGKSHSTAPAHNTVRAKLSQSANPIVKHLLNKNKVVVFSTEVIHKWTSEC